MKREQEVHISSRRKRKHANSKVKEDLFTVLRFNMENDQLEDREHKDTGRVCTHDCANDIPVRSQVKMQLPPMTQWVREVTMQTRGPEFRSPSPT